MIDGSHRFSCKRGSFYMLQLFVSVCVGFSFFQTQSVYAQETALSLIDNITPGHAVTAVLLALVFFLFLFGQLRHASIIKTLNARHANLDAENAQFHHRNTQLERLIDTQNTVYLLFEAEIDLPIVIGRLDNSGIPRRAEDILDAQNWLDRQNASVFLDNLMALKSHGEAFSMNVFGENDSEFAVHGSIIDAAPVIQIQCLDDYNREMPQLKSLHEKTQDRLYLFQNLIEKLPIPVWIENKQSDLEWANTAFVDLMDRGSLPDLRENYSSMIDDHQDLKIAIAQSGLLNSYREVVRYGAVPQLGSKSSNNDIVEQADILTRIPMPIALFNKDQHLEFWNKAFEQLWGFESKWLDNRPSINEILDSLHRQEKLPQEGHKSDFRTHFLSLFSNPKQKPHRWLLLDGRSIDITPFARKAGGVALMFEDVTTGIDLRSRIQDMVQLQKDTLDGISDGVIVFNSAGIVTLHNRAFCDMWQVESDHLDRCHIEQVFSHTSILHDDSGLWRKIKLHVTGIGESRIRLEGDIERPDGRAFDYTLEPLGAASYVLSFIDNTHHVRHQQELETSNLKLEEANQFKSDFVNNISYELRTLLTSVVGYGEFLYNEGGLSDNQEEYANYIVSASSSVLAIIDDILDLASIDVGVVDLEYDNVIISETIQSALGGVKSRFSKNNLQLEIHTDKQTKTFTADESRVRQTLFKLLSTAADSSKPNSKVILNCFTEKQFVAFSMQNEATFIEDEMINPDGIEASQNYLPGNSFDMSLTIVRNLVELHGGWVELQSSANGRRVITCYFPLRPDIELSASRTN